SRRAARTYINAFAAVRLDRSIVTVKGTNVPVCALKKSLRQPIEKSDEARPAIAASASRRSASPSFRCASSTRSCDRRSKLFCCDDASATATVHASSNVAAAARRDRARPFFHSTCSRFQRMKLKDQINDRRAEGPSQRPGGRQRPVKA